MVLTLGKFDGVHAGHRHLVGRVLVEADRRRTASAALILHPDPRTVLQGIEVPILATVEDRASRLRELGVDFVEPLQFTPAVAAMAPEQFVTRLSERFQLAAVVTGPDFRFGRGRSGDVATLAELGARAGFDVVVVSPLESDGEWVSSGRLRAAIAAGRVDTARTLLRRPCRVEGTVVHGSARGRGLGFPTANLDPIANHVVPADGIYAACVSWQEPNGRQRREVGVASVGVRPTFDHGDRLVEVHILDFDDDIYGCDLAVDFLARQRDERRFSSVPDLVAQMTRDVVRARRELALEVKVAAGAVRAGRFLRAVGRDLADVAEALANIPAGDVSDPAAGHRCRRLVHVEAEGEEAVLRTWVTRRAASSGAGLVRAHVYHAGPCGLHALVETLGTASAAADVVPMRLERLVRRAGRYEAVVAAASATEAPAPTSTPGDGARKGPCASRF